MEEENGMIALMKKRIGRSGKKWVEKEVETKKGKETAWFCEEKGLDWLGITPHGYVRLKGRLGRKTGIKIGNPFKEIEKVERMVKGKRKIYRKNNKRKRKSWERVIGVEVEGGSGSGSGSGIIVLEEVVGAMGEGKEKEKFIIETVWMKDWVEEIGEMGA